MKVIKNSVRVSLKKKIALIINFARIKLAHILKKKKYVVYHANYFFQFKNMIKIGMKLGMK